MKTYYNILTTIKNQLLQDNDCNSVTEGSIWEIDLDKQTLAPLSHIQVNNATRQNNTYVFNITVYCMDIVDKNPKLTTDKFRGNDNEQDVLNTQLAVGARLMELMERGDLRTENFALDGEPQFESFTERFENFWAGWAVTFNVQVPNEMTVCDNVLPPSDCADATYRITDLDGNTLYTGNIASGGSLVQEIQSSNVSNSNDSFSVDVLSEQDLELNDVTFNVTNSEDTELSTATVPAQENKTIQLLDINFTDSDGTITQEPSGVDLVCTPQTPCDPQLYQAAKVMQTGQVTSHTPNDDITRGRNVDFFTLDYVNEWGHSFRFCGVTGGYTDGASYFDVSGVATTKALAFPDSVLLDFSSRNIDEILTYYYGDVTTVRNYVVACALHEFSTFAGLTGWYLWNMKEMENLLSVDAYDTFSQWMGYHPFDFGSGQRYILTSTRTNSGVVIRTDLIATTYVGGSGVTSSLYNMFSRYTTLAELGL